MQPKWLSAPAIRWSECPKVLLPWLKTKTSMTKRMKNKATLAFDVQVVCHEWGMPFQNEIKRLNISEREMAIVREVILSIDKKPCIYARSIFPKVVLKGKGRTLKYLGDKSLGEFLFKQKELKRSDFEYARIRARDYYYQQIKKQFKDFESSSLLWGRRSAFELNEGALLVSEIFLPQIYDIN